VDARPHAPDPVNRAILVNGLPGAGKTTLARALSRTLGLPLFSKDTIKEAHADVLGTESRAGVAQREWNRMLGAAASQTMWALLGDAPGGAILESSWPSDTRHFVARGLEQAGGRSAIEIWCEVPLATARRRFEARHPRHPIHGDLPADAEWERLRETGRPLGVGPVLRVDTTGRVDIVMIAAWVRGFGDPPGAVRSRVSG
jgi:predicted kinase